jgi:hypothetical protein
VREGERESEGGRETEAGRERERRRERESHVRAPVPRPDGAPCSHGISNGGGGGGRKRNTARSLPGQITGLNTGEIRRDLKDGTIGKGRERCEERAR